MPSFTKNLLPTIVQCAALMLLLFAGAVVWLDRTPGNLLVDDTLYAGEIRIAAEKYGIDPDLVRAVIFQASRFNPYCRGSKGEYGLMQILPGGAVAEYARVKKVPAPGGQELFSVPVNLEIGCWFLAQGLREYRDYRHGVELALCRYNAGPGRAAKFKPAQLDGEVIPRITIKSTQRYVKDIMKRYRAYQRKNGKKP